MEKESVIESLKTLINEFDFANLMPDIRSLMGWIVLFARLCVIAAPIALLFFGLWYLLVPPEEANHRAGYRSYFGMGSVAAWRFAQKLAGIAWTAMGGIMTLVMVLISNGFPEMDPQVMVDKSVVCILWQLGLIVVSRIVMDIVLLIRYDRKGNLRRGKRN